MQSTKTYKLSILMLFLIAISSSCSHFVTENNKFKLTKEERSLLEKFFRYFMLHDSAIYTLTGSKPMTEVSLFYERTLTEEQLNDCVYFLLNRDDKQDMAFYNKLSSLEKKEKAYLFSEKDFIYHIEDLWEEWEKIQHRFPLKPKFLLIKKERPFDSWKDVFPQYKAIYDIFFVDVLKTAIVIHENYALFKEVIGTDFDPLDLVFEFGNEKSHFWDLLTGEDGWKYSNLWSILFGFGKENSFSYTYKNRHMKKSDLTEKEKLWSASIESYSSCKSRTNWTDRGAFTITNFSIPAFKSFVENDPVIAKYEAERERIKKLYKGKDFVDLTLELLTQPSS